jgi:hypothetical protein
MKESDIIARDTVTKSLLIAVAITLELRTSGIRGVDSPSTSDWVSPDTHEAKQPLTICGFSVYFLCVWECCSELFTPGRHDSGECDGG